MGFQFCGLFRRCQKVDQFTTVRSDQMTSRSGQEREPPRVVNLDLVHSDSVFRRCTQNDFRTAYWGVPRVKDPDCLQVDTKEFWCLFQRKSSAVYVSFIVL